MTSYKSYENKVAVVTGATQGLGEACATKLAEAKAAGIMVVGRNKERGQEVVQKIQQMGTKAHFLKLDLLDLNACLEVVPKTLDTFGRLDGLVNSAAFTGRDTLDSFSYQFFEKMLTVNVTAPTILMQSAIKAMKKTGGGAIVNILSEAMYGGTPDLVSYVASKAALGAITKNFAHTAVKHKILVNALAPSQIETPAEDDVQTNHYNNPNWLIERKNSMPLGQIIKPEELALMVLFILSGGSGTMNGSIIDYSQNVRGTKG